MKEQIAEYLISLYRDIPMAVHEGLLSVLCLGVVVIIACYGLKRGWRKISGLLLVEYISLIFCLTVIYRKGYEGAGHEFGPFWSYIAIQEGREELLVENIMNVVVFMPIGLLLGGGFSKWTWWKVIGTGCLLSISIELMQLVFNRGFCEVDDVIHNTLGCAIGWFMVKTSKLMVIYGSRLMVKG